MSIPVDKQELLAFEAMHAAATDPEQLAALELLFQHAAFGRNVLRLDLDPTPWRPKSRS